MNILVIDDDKMTSQALTHSLEELGHKPFVANDGEHAITKITNGEYDLVISDVMMPGISGLSLLNVLRTVHLCFTPVIMMSSLHNSPLIEASLRAGASDFISKPVTIEELAAKLSKYDKTNQ
ncbi:MAG: response regulator transcription factor [Bacteroidetes bacterium]|nr:response regulator transcription factor [Bacteroidota bacterium]